MNARNSRGRSSWLLTTLLISGAMLVGWQAWRSSRPSLMSAPEGRKDNSTPCESKEGDVDLRAELAIQAIRAQRIPLAEKSDLRIREVLRDLAPPAESAHPENYPFEPDQALPRPRLIVDPTTIDRDEGLKSLLRQAATASSLSADFVESISETTLARMRSSSRTLIEVERATSSEFTSRVSSAVSAWRPTSEDLRFQGFGLANEYAITVYGRKGGLNRIVQLYKRSGGAGVYAVALSPTDHLSTYQAYDSWLQANADLFQFFQREAVMLAR